jgi:hypothetical protein
VALPWIRLDTQFATNPKVLLLVEQKAHRALFVYVCGLGYAGAHGTDGYIPRGALPFLHGSKRDADQLVSVGLWRKNPVGYEINDWQTYQGIDPEATARSQKAKAAAMIRWHGSPHGPDEAEPA